MSFRLRNFFGFYRFNWAFQIIQLKAEIVYVHVEEETQVEVQSALFFQVAEQKCVVEEDFVGLSRFQLDAALN